MGDLNIVTYGMTVSSIPLGIMSCALLIRAFLNSFLARASSFSFTYRRPRPRGCVGLTLLRMGYLLFSKMCQRWFIIVSWSRFRSLFIPRDYSLIANTFLSAV